MEQTKPWECNPGSGHVLGHVRRNGSGVRVLVLYRETIDLAAEQPEAVDVIAVVEGYVADVRCSICGCSRTWVPGQEALARLLEQVRRR